MQMLGSDSQASPAAWPSHKRIVGKMPVAGSCSGTELSQFSGIRVELKPFASHVLT